MTNENQIGVSTVNSFRNLTEQRLDMKVPDQTLDAWLSLARTIRVADDVLDNEAERDMRLLICFSGVNFLSGISNDLPTQEPNFVREMSLLRNHLDALPKHGKDTFLRNLKVLLRVSESVKHADDPVELAKLTLLEGQVTARLFVDFLPQEYRGLSEYNGYLDYILKVSRGVNAFDSLVDMGADYKSGIVAAKPSIKNRLLFAVTTMPTAANVLVNTRPEVVGLFVKGASAIFKDKNADTSIHLKTD